MRPLPTEKRENYVARAMRSHELIRSFPVAATRQAVALNFWEQRRNDAFWEHRDQLRTRG